MKREAGFTLLEILMVLTLLGVLLALVAGALLGANRAVAKAQRFACDVDEVRAAQNFLRVAISHALPLPLSGEQDGNQPVFIGQSSAMTFVGPLSPALGGGLYQQRIRLVDHRAEVGFARLTAQGEQTLVEPQTLLHGVHHLRLSYRGTTPDGKPTAWLSEWPWPKRLPRAVRIDAGLSGDADWVMQQVDVRLDLSSEPVTP